MNNTLRLLDSSVVIKHFREGGRTSERLESLEGLYLPSIALGELYGGAYRSARPEKTLAQVETFLAGVIVISADDETSKHYGRISAQLAAHGTPIPQNDMWIAAIAIQWDLTLATADGHFDRVAGLSLDKW